MFAAYLSGAGACVVLLSAAPAQSADYKTLSPRVCEARYPGYEAKRVGSGGQTPARIMGKVAGGVSEVACPILRDLTGNRTIDLQMRVKNGNEPGGDIELRCQLLSCDWEGGTGEVCYSRQGSTLPEGSFGFYYMEFGVLWQPGGRMNTIACEMGQNDQLTYIRWWEA